MGVEIRDGWLYGTLPDDKGKEWPVHRFRQEAARGPLRQDPPNLVLHTTETSGYVESLRYPSNFQTGEGMIGQHIRLGYAGDSLWTWDAYSMQIEMVSRSELKLWLPDEPTLGPTIALTAWLHKTGRIRTGLKRPADWPHVLDRGPQAVESYYRRHAGVWPNTAGVYGHVDIPDNSHWDPGSFNYPVFFDRVATALGIGSPDEGDDIVFEKWYAGRLLHEQGKPRPDEAGWERKGWLDREQEIRDAVARVGDVSTPPHAHPEYAEINHQHQVSGKTS